VKSARWDRGEIVARVRRDIWRHLTAAARNDDDVLLDAAALLQMPAAEVRALAQIHFILSGEVGQLLVEMPVLVRRLTTTTNQELEFSAERVRGAIRWSETFTARAVSGVPNVFVTAPSRRAYNTPENELLIFALTAIADFGRRTGWHRSTSADAGNEVRRRVAAATRWLHTRALADITLQAPAPKTIARVRSGRNRHTYRSILDVIGLYGRFIARLDRGSIREAVERHALATSRDPVLLELLCAFRIMAGLRALGWKSGPTRLLHPPRLLRAVKDDRVLDLYYQHAPSGLGQSSVYRDIQHAHQFASVGGLIPDLVMRVERPGSVHWLMFEVKGVERAVEASARAAAFDLLAYRRAFKGTLEKQEGPYAVGIAWGRELGPSSDGEIVFCSPDTIIDALKVVL
jgi:hypothetical protein